MMQLDFKKDKLGNWYVVLPEWEGDKDDLEMIRNIDIMLEILSQGEGKVSITISTESFDSQFTLTEDFEDDGGMWYRVKSDMFDFSLWLCFVTRHIFGYFPPKLYISKNC